MLPNSTTTPKISDTPQPSGKGTGSSIEDRALSLLGSGVPAVSVAAALGVTESRISQLLASPVFTEKVSELRYESLQSYTKRDASYDTLEDKLLLKLEKSLAYMIKPGEILKAIQVVNGATRRGAKAASDSTVSSANIVNIVLPTIITQKFQTNTKNQVIKAGTQELLTLPAHQLLKETKEKEEKEASKEAEATSTIDTPTQVALTHIEETKNDGTSDSTADLTESLHGPRG